MNLLYQEMNQNNIFQQFQQFQQFLQNFRGDPKQQVQQLLNSGKITQEQYNVAVQKVPMLQKMFQNMFPNMFNMR